LAKILIVKLGYSETLDPEISRTSSLGDVLRTTVLLHKFKDDHVSWLVDEHAYPLLEDNPLIQRILIYDLNSVLQLQHERFDTVINLEKVPGICALCDSIDAWRRFGFRFDSSNGTAQAYDHAERAMSLCDNKDLKKNHEQYWQEALYHMIGAEWDKEEYILGYKPKSSVQYDIGFNWSVGSKWPNKAWKKENWKKLEEIIGNKFTVCYQKGMNELHEYIEWVNSCRLLITNDSLGLHIAFALRKKTIALYGPTSSKEICLYNRGIILLPETDYECIPCLIPTCTQEKVCMDHISPERVFKAAVKILGSTGHE
jgi:heptosyltransferase-2